MIAISGLGVVSGFGWGLDPLVEGVWSGASAIGATPYPGVGPLAALAGGPWLATDLALYAAREALGDRDPARTALVVASTAGDMVVGEAAYLAVCGGSAPTDDFVWAQRCDRPTTRLARTLGLGGPRLTVSSACSSGVVALGVARDWVAAGRAEAVLVVGVDALCRLTVHGFSSLGLISARPCRPFDAERDGISLGEGAAALLIESEAAMTARGARPRAWLRGYGNAQDAHHMTAPHPEAAGLAAAIGAALDGLDPTEVGYVNAHGTGTLPNDAAEGALLARLLPGAAVSSTKGATGHTLGAAGALEALITVLALERGVLPPNAGLHTPGVPLDLVRVARPTRVRHALSLSAAFGGSCAAVWLEAPCGAR